jgi:hypothetical protein
MPLTTMDRIACARVIPAAAIADVEALFELAGNKGDCCLQAGGNPVVFGGSNRVFVYRDGTVKVSKFHCSDRFIETAVQLGFEIFY